MGDIRWDAKSPRNPRSSPLPWKRFLALWMDRSKGGVQDPAVPAPATSLEGLTTATMGKTSSNILFWLDVKIHQINLNWVNCSSENLRHSFLLASLDSSPNPPATSTGPLGLLSRRRLRKSDRTCPPGMPWWMMTCRRGRPLCPPKFGDTTQKDRDGFLKGERNDVGVDLG